MRKVCLWNGLFDAKVPVELAVEVDGSDEAHALGEDEQEREKRGGRGERRWTWLNAARRDGSIFRIFSLRVPDQLVRD